MPWFALDCAGEYATHPDCEGRSGPHVFWGALGSRASALADLDDDGDLDIVTNEFNAPPLLLISDLSDQKADLNFLKLRLIGTRSNRDGLGAVVSVHTRTHTYTRVHDGKSGYLSQSLLPLYFGLGPANTVERIEVQWPSGTAQTVAGPIESNQLVEIREP